MHYTLQPARALIARRITISFFLVVSKQSRGRRALPVQSSPQPNCSRAGRKQQGAILTLIITLNWGLFDYNPTEAVWSSMQTCWWPALDGGLVPRQLLRQPPSTLALPGARESQHQTSLVGQRSGKLKRSVSPWERYPFSSHAVICASMLFFFFFLKGRSCSCAAKFNDQGLVKK